MGAWIAAAVVAAFALILALRRLRMRRRSAATTRRPPPRIVVSPEDHRAVAVLDIERARPNAAPVRRLVREAAARVFRLMPFVEEVEVRSSVGVVLGVVNRTSAWGRGIRAPNVFLQPHLRRSRGPDLSAHLLEQEQVEPPIPVTPLTPTFSLPPSPPRRPLADQFDLTEAVRSRIVDPDDPMGLVRAILEAGGLEVEVEVDGDFLRAGDVAVVVIDPRGVSVTREMLDHAFIRIELSGALRGLVIGLGVLDVDDVRRRETWAPHVLHSGREGIQRMADAVAVGADPLRFAAAPALTVIGTASAIGRTA